MRRKGYSCKAFAVLLRCVLAGLNNTSRNLYGNSGLDSLFVETTVRGVTYTALSGWTRLSRRLISAGKHRQVTAARV